jgi:hypothetical protein
MPETTEEKKMPEQTQSEEKGQVRPPGCDIYCLLVGINNYRSIRDLRGCIADLDQVEDFLKKRFNITDGSEKSSGFGSLVESFGKMFEGKINWEKLPEYTQTYPIEGEDYGALKILRLEDKNATYDDIIKGFEKFLGQATEKDCVWFHFSGHGTISATAPEFKHRKNGKDNCLMCHDFKMTGNGKTQGLLADKELAQLLNVVAKDGLYHLLVTLDCCHAGSGTRAAEKIDEEWGNRSQDLGGSDLPRTLEEYYGYKVGDEYMPPPSHVVLSACNNLQLAGDGGKGGAFTSGLISALENAKNGPGMINYADLHTQTRFSVQQIRQSQTPQFDVIGDVQAYSLFLDGRPDGDPDRYPVEFMEDIGWVVNCGAIHHLPEKPDQPITLSIYEQDGEEPILKTQVLSVGPQYSTFEVEEGVLSEKTPPFYGVFNHIPAAKEYVKISGSDEAGIQALKDAWTDKARALNIDILEDDSPFTLEVVADNGAYVLNDLRLGRPTKTTYTTDKPENVLSDLITIVKWRRSVDLEKDRSSLEDKIEFSFILEGGDDKKVTISTDDDGKIQMEGASELKADMEVVEAPVGIEEKEVILHASKDTMLPKKKDKWRVYAIQPEIKVKDQKEELFFYLFYLYENYKIVMYSYAKDFQPESSSGIIEYKVNDIGLSANSNEFVYHLKLIATTKPLDYHQLLQDGIPGQKFEASASEDPDQGLDDWWVIHKTLRVVRKD